MSTMRCSSLHLASHSPGSSLVSGSFVRYHLSQASTDVSKLPMTPYNTPCAPSWCKLCADHAATCRLAHIFRAQTHAVNMLYRHDAIDSSSHVVVSIKLSEGQLALKLER